MKRILFVGGGTLGPVTPLLAVANAIRHLEPSAVFAWAGTPDGPERALVQQANIPFFTIPVVKWPRYPTLQWLVLPFKWLAARRASERLIRDWKPDVVVSAGGFTAVPVILAASRHNIPCVTHQLDKEPGLANRRIASHCQSVTTSFEYETSPFSNIKTERIATPVRFDLSELPSRSVAANYFGLDSNRPIILIFGGGTGAQILNDMITENLDKWLAFTQLVHGTGAGKEKGTKSAPGYVMRPYLGGIAKGLNLEEMLVAYAAADLIIMRGGIGSFSEAAAALRKPSIIIPIPHSHQEKNTGEFADAGAAIVLSQESPTFAQDLLAAAHGLLQDAEERVALGRRAQELMPTDDGTALAKRVLGILKG